MFKLIKRKEFAAAEAELQKFRLLIYTAEGLHTRLKNVVDSDVFYGFEASLANVYRIIGYPRFNSKHFKATPAHESYYWENEHGKYNTKSSYKQLVMARNAVEEINAILHMVLDYQKYAEVTEDVRVVEGRTIFCGLVTSIFGHNLPEISYATSSLCNTGYIADLRMRPFPRAKDIVSVSPVADFSTDDSGFIS
jgi:hypothetical protein